MYFCKFKLEMYVLFMPISLVRELQTKIEEEVGVDFHKIISEADKERLAKSKTRWKSLCKLHMPLTGCEINGFASALLHLYSVRNLEILV